MKDGRAARSVVLQRRQRIADQSAWALSAGSFLLLLALLFGSSA